MAQLKVDDPQTSHFFHPYPKLKCNEEKNWIYTKNQTFIIDENAVNIYGRIQCIYSNIWRVSDSKVDSELKVNYPSGSAVMTDFFEARCSSENGSTYSNVHTTIKPLPEVIKRSKTAKPNDKMLGLNVYMFGFDTVSRMHFMRKLPKTYRYITSNLGGIVLEGYNIVGDGTPQALIPILTGKTELELPLTRKRYSNADYVNVYPFVWNEFRNAGYATMYGEDAPGVGTFTYRLKGFNEQPTDHYIRSFYLAAEAQQQKHKHWCWGHVPHHKVHFGYGEDFFSNYPRFVRKFTFLYHSEYSHDDINAIEIADDDMVEHLKFFETNGHLNDTIIIVMSDHGPRFAKVRETQQGKLEERLPFFAFIFPPWFEKQYPLAVKNFRLNAKRLTTPFDIHPTLQSVLNFEYPPKMGDLKNRGINLFDEVPLGRTCADAHIQTHWCTCLSWKVVKTTDATVKHIAQNLVDKINQETDRERQLCANLALKTIEKALIYKPNKDLIRFRQSKDADGEVADLSGKMEYSVQYYQINFRTTPGDALYEASVTWDIKINNAVINLNDVSHINAYGDLPHCIIDKDYFLAKWCVCLDKV